MYSLLKLGAYGLEKMYGTAVVDGTLPCRSLLEEGGAGGQHDSYKTAVTASQLCQPLPRSRAGMCPCSLFDRQMFASITRGKAENSSERPAEDCSSNTNTNSCSFDGDVLQGPVPWSVVNRGLVTTEVSPASILKVRRFRRSGYLLWCGVSVLGDVVQRAGGCRSLDR